VGEYGIQELDDKFYKLFHLSSVLLEITLLNVDRSHSYQYLLGN